MKTIIKQESPERDTFEKWKIDSKINESSSDKLWDLFDTPENEEGEKINPKRSLQQALLKEQGYICCYCGKRITEDNVVIEHFFPKTENRDCTFNYYNLHASCEGGGYKDFFVRTEHKDILDIQTEIGLSKEELVRLNPKLKELSKGKKFSEIYSKGSKLTIQKQPFTCDNLKESNANNSSYIKQDGKKDKNGNKESITSPFILSPLIQNVDKRFRYENDGSIKANNYTDEIAQNTLILLGLNSNTLCKERKKVLEVISDIFKYYAESSFEELENFLHSEIENTYKPHENDMLDEYCFVKMWFLRSNT